MRTSEMERRTIRSATVTGRGAAESGAASRARPTAREVRFGMASGSAPVEAVELPPGEDPAAASLLRFLAAVDDDAAGDLRGLRPAEGLRNAFERRKGLASRRLGSLDLHQHESGTLLNYQINLQAAAVSIKGEPRPASAMKVSLGDLGDDPSLEEGSPQRMGSELTGILDVEEIGGQTRVVEVELGSLDEPLAD